jgi:hypothetical protein
MTQFAEQLRRLRLSPDAGPSTEDFVARVMAAWAGALLTAAACVAVGFTFWPPHQPRGEVITARGGKNLGLTATVQAFVGHATAGAPPALLEGATLRPGDGILVRYSNPAPKNVYLMVFAIDAKGTVHWIHPAYLSLSTNPTSLKLEPQATERVLPEVAEPEDPAPGAMQVYALLSREALDVQSVERRLAAATQAPPELFPEAEVEAWRCTWAP